MEFLLVRPGRLADLAQIVCQWRAAVIDTETTGVDIHLTGRAIGFALVDLYDDAERAYYIPVAHHDADNVSVAEIQEHLLPALAGKPLLGYNIKFDLHVLNRLVGDLSHGRQLCDVLVMARLLATEERPALDLRSVVLRELGYEYKSRAAGHEGDFGKRSYSVHDIGIKCCEDVVCTRRLYLHFKAQMPDSLKRLFLLECKLTHSLFQMEKRGVRFDRDALLKLDAKLAELESRLTSEIDAEAGTVGFNPQSHNQVVRLMTQLGIQSPFRTAKGQPSWGRAAMQEINHPIALKIAQFRAIAAVHANFVGHLLEYAKLGLDSVHCSYQNWGTVTGRLSAVNPNLQGVAAGWLQLGIRGDRYEPLRWDDGPDRTISLREVLVPREGYAFLVADWRQMEMFIAGWYLQDPTFLQLLQSEDFHAATAEKIWGSRQYRDRAKWFNFGLLYGLGLKGLAQRLGVSVDEATRYRDEYFAAIPSYSRVLSAIKNRLESVGYVENAYGRRYYATQGYVAFNYLVQGSAADYVKFRISLNWDWYRSLGLHPIMTTHDEIVFEVPVGEMPWLGELVNVLEAGQPFGMRLPVKVKMSERNLGWLTEVDVGKKTEK